MRLCYEKKHIVCSLVKSHIYTCYKFLFTEGHASYYVYHGLKNLWVNIKNYDTMGKYHDLQNPWVNIMNYHGINYIIVKLFYFVYYLAYYKYHPWFYQTHVL